MLHSNHIPWYSLSVIRTCVTFRGWFSVCFCAIHALEQKIMFQKRLLFVQICTGNSNQHRLVYFAYIYCVYMGLPLFDKSWGSGTYYTCRWVLFMFRMNELETNDRICKRILGHSKGVKILQYIMWTKPIHPHPHPSLYTPSFVHA